MTSVSVSGEAGFGRIYKCSGGAGSVDDADCSRVKCLRSVGGRRSMF